MLSSAKVTNPEDLIISKEELDDIERNIGHILSDLEWEVLEGYLDGRSYQEMAEVTDRSVKSIDNALQRVKRKLEKMCIRDRVHSILVVLVLLYLTGY